MAPSDPSPKPESPNSRDALKEMESGNSASEAYKLNEKVKKKKNKGKGKQSDEDTEFTTKLPTVMKKSKGKVSD